MLCRYIICVFESIIKNKFLDVKTYYIIVSTSGPHVIFYPFFIKSCWRRRFITGRHSPTTSFPFKKFSHLTSTRRTTTCTLHDTPTSKIFSKHYISTYPETECPSLWIRISKDNFPCSLVILTEFIAILICSEAYAELGFYLSARFSRLLN